MLWLKNILTKIVKAPQKPNKAETIPLSETDFPSPPPPRKAVWHIKISPELGEGREAGSPVLLILAALGSEDAG